MISTRSLELLIDTVVCLTPAKWETVSGRFGGYLTCQGRNANPRHEFKQKAPRFCRGAFFALFYKQVTLCRGLPFPVRIPNAATRKALRDARHRKNIESFDSVATWPRDMRSP